MGKVFGEPFHSLGIYTLPFIVCGGSLGAASARVLVADH